MSLGIERGKVFLVDYDRNWAREYVAIKNKIVEATILRDSQIEHVGSTSIRGCRAKPIIDILVGVEDYKSLDKDFYKQMQNIGYYRLQVSREDSIVMASFKDNDFSIHTCFIHLANYPSLKWEEMIKFRDILNSNVVLRDEYIFLKNHLQEQYWDDRSTYTKRKGVFIKKVLENASSD
ncbi:GrpB family protein [Salinicoccus sesuvii]|uniref:GrpB family protein n=1 Tax=Salinicoccus sesuvii TaxID=868281 RepID=A0ABV7N8N9_9STAP